MKLDHPTLPLSVPDVQLSSAQFPRGSRCCLGWGFPLRWGNEGPSTPPGHLSPPDVRAWVDLVLMVGKLVMVTDAQTCLR